MENKTVFKKLHEGTVAQAEELTLKRWQEDNI